MTSLLKYLIIALCFITVSSSKLNLPRVLLPLSKSAPTNFSLKVTDDGCYTWSLSRLDIIQIVPVNHDKELDCSSEVILSTITKEFTKNTVIVLVEEVVTKEVLRCDVIVDVISSLYIVTKTRQLFVEESPEIFEVRSYDEQGNEFSTLEGIEFSWTITSGKGSDYRAKNDVIRLINFRDSPYEIPKTIRELDLGGLTGHVVLLEGVKTGTASISASLKLAEYKHVPSASVQIDVIANLVVEPSDAYVMEGDVIFYKLLQVKNGRFIEVPLPSAQYSLIIEDGSVARQYRPWAVETLAVGQTKLMLSDVNSQMSNNDESTYLPSVTLSVVTPVSMHLILLPYRNWITAVSQSNAIVAEVYDSLKHKIHIGPHALIETKIDNSFQITEATKNGSYVSGYARESSVIHIFAQFNSIRKNDGSKIKFDQITAEAEITVYPGLKISPPQIIIPWDSVESMNLDYHLNVTGGDGHYQWSVANSQVVVVTQTGILKPRSLGQTNVTVSMQKNPNIQTSAIVEILPPTRLAIVHNTVEAQLGLPVFLEVALYHDKKEKTTVFTDCYEFPFQIESSNSNFVHYANSRAVSSPEACANIRIVGNHVGNSIITISYKIDGKLLKDHARVSSYDPLKLVTPEVGKTVLSVGAQRYIVFSGGPAIGTNEDASIQVKVDDSLISIRKVFSTSSSYERIYVVTCHDVGDSLMELNMLNRYSLDNGISVTSVYLIQIICAHPKNVQLSVEMGNSRVEACPSSFRSKNIVLNEKPVILKVSVTDERGNVFDNATSVEVKWTSSNPDLAAVGFPGALKLKEEIKQDYRVPLYHYQSIVPTSKSGNVEVTARIFNYRMGWLKKLNINFDGIRSKMMKNPNEESISLNLVPSLHLSSDYLVIFNHPKNVAKLYVTHGSGFYEISSTAENSAQVTYSDSSKTLDIVPLLRGNFNISIHDVCLDSDAVTVNVRILTIEKIEVDVIDKVERGGYVKAYVRLFDSEDNVVTKKELVNLKSELDSGFIKSDCEFGSRNDAYIVCSIRGLEVGFANLVFKAGLENQPTRSAPIRIQVYPPLQIVPRNITLIPGAKIQLSVKGGPQPDCSIEYSVDGRAVKVDNSGNVVANELGEGFVTAQATGIRPSGKKIVYSEDTVTVNVVHLKGIRLKTSLNRVRSGSKIATWVEGIPKQINPIILASVTPSLVFHWDVSPPNLARVSNVLEDAGIRVSDNDKVSMRMHALKSGLVIVSVKVTAPKTIVPDGHKGKFSDSVSLSIYDALEAADFPYSPVLLGPAVKYQLKTNKDKVTKVTFRADSVNGDQPLVLEVDKTGLIMTHSRYGYCYIRVDSAEDNESISTVQIPIKVARVQYMMMNVVPDLQLDPTTSLFGMPKGMKLKFFISYHDNEGNKFTMTSNNLKIQSDKIEKIHVSQNENQVTIDLLETGLTTLKVFNDDPGIAPDFVKIRTVPYIQPDKTELTVGDVVCFQAPLLFKDIYSCSWNSSNDLALSIDPKTGFAIAKLKLNSILVSFKCSNGLEMVTTANVYALHKIEIRSGSLPNISNNGKTVYAPLALLNEADDEQIRKIEYDFSEKCKSQTSEVTYPYECGIEFKNQDQSLDIRAVFATYPQYNPNYGHTCVIESKLVEVPDAGEDTKVVLTVTWSRYQNTNIELSFKPAIMVAKSKLIISNEEPVASLRIKGVPEVLRGVQVLPSNDAFIGISEELSEMNVIRKYSVYLKSSFFRSTSCEAQPLNVYVVSKNTNQNISILLQVDAVADQYTSPNYIGEQFLYYGSEYLLKGMLPIILVLVVFYIGTKIYSVTFGKGKADQTFSDYSHNRSHLERSLSPHQSYLKPSYNEIQMIYGRDPDNSFRRRKT